MYEIKQGYKKDNKVFYSIIKAVRGESKKISRGMRDAHDQLKINCRETIMK